MRAPQLHVHAAPFAGAGVTTSRVMLDVNLALVPVALGAAWYYGLAAILVIAASILGAVAAEWAFKRQAFALRDGTLILTGFILGLTLPPTLPLWMAFLGGGISIGLGRIIWGGLGQNVFNPALVGRAFLQAAFPTALTTWTTPGNLTTFFRLPDTLFALPLMKVPAVEQVGGDVDVITTATPLASMKFDRVATDLWTLLVGNTGGSLGETVRLLIIAGGLYLLWRRAFDWRIPASIFVTVAVFAGVLHAVNPAVYPTPAFVLSSGGLLLGALFMATDPVTSPMSPLGAWLFGIGVGALTVLIRVWGGLAEGVMYAILLMNAATPLIDRFLQPIPFGRRIGKAKVQP